MDKNAYELAAASPQAYRLGLLGPDVFFSDRLPPPLFKPHQKELGNRLHDLPAADTVRVMIEEADCAAMRAYILGFLCHFALDATMHPFIESQYTGAAHTRFEFRQELPLCRAVGDARVACPPRELYEDDAAAAVADILYARLHSRLFGEQTQGSYLRSYRKWKRVHTLAYDPEGKKCRALLPFEKLIGKEGLVTGFLITVDPTDTRSLFNKTHAPWAAPWDKARVRTESYMDLTLAARSYALLLVQYAAAALTGGDAAPLYEAMGRGTMSRGEV